MAVTRTPTVENPGVVKVATSKGQYLHFIVDAGGPIPIFTFASSAKGVLYEASDFSGHPKTKYEWDHLKNPSDIQQLDELELRIAFLTNAKYTCTVDLNDDAGNTTVVLQIDYAGTPMDKAPESFTVVIQ
ncbi:MAG: hypothetical protein DMG78_12835 [Acidobacteria bacterium]|jgi:hypothetical protein|nr:MAG: hypothetical protein DMG78_12835 [Acidobacteriota bacterium]